MCDPDLSSELKSAARTAFKKMACKVEIKVPVLMSGAGHDAMAMAHLTKEHVLDDDVGAAGLAILSFLETLGAWMIPQRMASLQSNYYDETCLGVEDVVRVVVAEKIKESFDAVPKLIHFYFQVCFLDVRSAAVNSSELAAGAFNPAVDFASPLDGDGHGSHTASIAAENNGIPVRFHGYEFGKASGMAPHA
ncbi:hypothetical protein Droror1_Dr00008336, partial [Drosera rotundifolia]